MFTKKLREATKNILFYCQVDEELFEYQFSNNLIQLINHSRVFCLFSLFQILNLIDSKSNEANLMNRELKTIWK